MLVVEEKTSGSPSPHVSSIFLCSSVGDSPAKGHIIYPLTSVVTGHTYGGESSQRKKKD